MNEKIIFFIPNFSMGGAENMLINLANYCGQKKIPIAFVVMNINGPLRERLDSTIPVYNLNARRMALAVFKLYRWVITNNSKVFISTLFQANLAVLIVKYLSFNKIKVIIRIESNMTRLSNDRMNLSAILKIFFPIFPYFFKKADKIITVSKNIEEDLKKNHYLKNTITIYNPAITIDFRDKIDESITEPWWPKNSKIILSTGRLNPVKDFPTLIMAFKELNYPDTYLIILGEGICHQELKNQVKQLKIGDRVILPGFVRNPLKFVKKSNVFVLPSKYEGFSNALVEAVSCNIPIIVSDCTGGNKEILENGKYGDFFPVGDFYTLSALLKKNLDDPNQRKIPYSWIKKFHYTTIYDKYISLIQSFSN